MGDISIRFWGVRGAIPCPGPNYAVFGGNTACVEVRCGGRLIVLDAGSGLRGLGRQLMSAAAPVDFDLLLSHCHVDHMIGLPFFEPAYSTESVIRIMAGNLLPLTTVRDAVAQMMTPPLFPIMPEAFTARMTYRDFRAGDSLTLGPDVVVETAPLMHPGGATGYRIRSGDRALVYVTDNEHRPDGPDRGLIHLARDADLMIYDATYTPDEYPARIGWGHSTWPEAIRLAKTAGVKRLALFHHDPAHDDTAMAHIEAKAREAFADLFAARDGMAVLV